MSDHPHFIADSLGGSRKDTAILLTGTAREFHVHQREIKAVQGGFRVTQNMHDVLYDEGVLGRKTKKTSGNRAAKNKPTEE